MMFYIIFIVCAQFCLLFKQFLAVLCSMWYIVPRNETMPCAVET